MKVCHICYHTDEDGIASAAVIYEYLKRINKGDKNVRYFFYKIGYTINLKNVLKNIPSGDEIYFVDYSFSNRENLEYVLELSNNDIKIVWIDHHATSKSIIYGVEYPDIDVKKYSNFYYFINTNYCAAYSVYIYAYLKLNKEYSDYEISTVRSNTIDNIYIPSYIKYVDSWDTWKHNMPNTTEFNIGINSIDHGPRNIFSLMCNHTRYIINCLFCKKDDENSINILESYMEKYICNVIDKGKTIKDYLDIQNELICNEYGFEFSIIDYTDSCRRYKCFAVNKCGNSTMFGDRINTYDIVVPFRFKGNTFVYFLFTAKDDIQCNELAKKLGSYNNLGGGGHAKAAGFQSFRLLLGKNCVISIKNKIFKHNEYKISTTANYIN